MSAEYRLTDQEVYETGLEPEYSANKLVRYEPVGTDMVRIYVASERGPRLRMEFSALVNYADLVVMARAAMDIAATIHNHVTLASAVLKARGH